MKSRQVIADKSFKRLECVAVEFREDLDKYPSDLLAAVFKDFMENFSYLMTFDKEYIKFYKSVLKRHGLKNKIKKFKLITNKRRK